jgi:hypothetical protein
LNDLIRKETENRLFEIICSEIDINSNARNISIARLTNSIITQDKVIDALDNLVKSNLIKNVVVDITGKISCQMTLDGLKMFHEKVNA